MEPLSQKFLYNFRNQFSSNFEPKATNRKMESKIIRTDGCN